MVSPVVKTASQDAPPKFARYRSVRERRASSKDEDTMRPVSSGENKMKEQNPSITRSMSRYRRKRPSANDGSPAAMLPSIPAPPEQEQQARARAETLNSVPDDANQSHVVQEERIRARHRQHAMEQLTGGNPGSDSIPLRPAKPEKEVRSKHSMNREQAQATQGAHVSGNGHQGRANATANEGTRKSFFQKVGLTKSKDTARQDEAPRYIGVGGGGIVPGIDAPVSAVNAGERHVIVQYSDTSIQMPVTPSTRVGDLLLSASQMFRGIDLEKFILLESFHQLGLERPLRRYERVRDIMNSWAHDADNRLVIIPLSSMNALAQLDAQKAPTEKPAETTVYLYHSQRPGKWDKRYVTLRIDGQILVSKKEKSGTSTNICHLSDFDIYSPSARALAKEIKPPKEICFAIKSQEKSSMFLSTENFIHFFSTNDRTVADQWYRVTQAWRSWYLINEMGVAEKPEVKPVSSKRSLLGRQGSKTAHHPGGSQEPFSHLKCTREHAPPPTSFSKSLTIDTDFGQGPLLKGMSSAELEAATFSPTGLLGRNYTQRQQAMRVREEREKRVLQEPFSAHGLLGGSPVYSPGCASTGRSNTLTQAPDTLSRGASVKQKHKPLVDLTPVYHEPPQHARKGRGVTVEPGMQLIDAATGPDIPPGGVAIPPATAWRRPSVDIDGGGVARHRSNTVRSARHVSHKVSRATSAEASPVVPSDPFLPNSLLASSHWGSNQGKLAAGHGVATGDRNATRPLLDMSPESPFVEGSLLRKL